MPKGVEVLVDDGFATIDFTDRALRGPGLARLIAVGGPETIETLTLTGPRRLYRVPEGNAREAGLLDTAPSVKVKAAPADDAPDETWLRADLNAYAAKKFGLDTTGLSNKQEVLDAIAEERKS